MQKSDSFGSCEAQAEDVGPRSVKSYLFLEFSRSNTCPFQDSNVLRADRFNLLPLWVQAVELISVASLALRCHLLSSLSQGPIVLVHPEHG